MNFWKRLRLIGSVIVLGIAIWAVLLAVKRAPSADDDTPDSRPPPSFKQQSGTKGL
jgi:hypothetical protein